MDCLYGYLYITSPFSNVLFSVHYSKQQYNALLSDISNDLNGSEIMFNPSCS